jgi:prolipoprotein diacylglyceryltransferase
MGLLFMSISCFVRFFLTGIQHKNLQHSKYLAIAITSMAMAVADMLVIRYAVSEKASCVLVVAALSNSCGITLSVWLHDRQKNRRVK